MIVLMMILNLAHANVDCDQDYIQDNPELKGDYSTYGRYKRYCERQKRRDEVQEEQLMEERKQTQEMRDDK